MSLFHKCYPLTVDVLLSLLSLSLTPDDKRNRSALKGLQGDVHSDRVRADNQRTYPDNIAQADLARLQHLIITDGLSHSGACHLQIGNSGHNTLPLDHMIGQEKLVTVKGRTELLFPQGGGGALDQRMQCYKRWSLYTRPLRRICPVRCCAAGSCSQRVCPDGDPV